MGMTLRNEDARAVDLILDRAAAAHGEGTMLFAGEAAVSNEQIAAVEKVLQLLEAMPAAEPAADLLRRTMERIASAMPAHLHAERPELTGNSGPVA